VLIADFITVKNGGVGGDCLAFGFCREESTPSRIYQFICITFTEFNKIQLIATLKPMRHRQTSRTDALNMAHG
jgi:hypothetical protein